MTDLIWGLYPAFLDAGYGPSLFWNLSVEEINDLLESYARRKEREQRQREAMLKDEIMLLFNQAIQIGNVTGRIMDKNVDILPPEHYYPDLFADDAGDNKEQSSVQGKDEPKLSREMELHKARMDDFVFRHNRAIRERLAKEGGESDGGHDTGAASGDHKSADEGVLR